VVAAALIRDVALAPLASVPTARMEAPVVAPVVVVALVVSAICRDLIASSGLVSVSALLGFLFLCFLKLLVVVVHLVFVLLRVLRRLTACSRGCRHNLPCFQVFKEKLAEKPARQKLVRRKNTCKQMQGTTMLGCLKRDPNWTQDANLTVLAAKCKR
jgi:hypothetical protein